MDDGSSTASRVRQQETSRNRPRAERGQVSVTRRNRGAKGGRKALDRLRVELANIEAGRPPNKFVMLGAMQDTAKRILSRSAWSFFDSVAGFAKRDNAMGDWFAFPAIATIAEQMGVSERTAARARNECEAKGVLIVVPGGGRESNTYLINHRPWIEQRERELALQLAESDTDDIDDDIAPATDLSSHPCQERHPIPVTDGRAPLTRMAEEQSNRTKQENKPSTTTPSVLADEPTDTGIADVGGGGRSLDEVEAELKAAGVADPATRRRLAQRDDITPQVVREISKKNRRAGGGLIVTILNDRDQVAATRAAKRVAIANAWTERNAAEEQAEQERRRHEAEAEAQAAAADQTNTKIIDKLKRTKGQDYIDQLHREANEQTSGFFRLSSINGTNGKSRQLRACVVGIVAERCREHLRGLPPELVAEAAGTAPESVPTWISNTNDTDAIKAASKATKLNTTTANA